MPKILRLYVERIEPAALAGAGFGEFWRTFPTLLRSGGYHGRLELVVKIVLPAPDSRVEVPSSMLSKERAGLPVDRIWLWGQHWDRRKVFLNRGTREEIFAGWRRLFEGLGPSSEAIGGLFFDLEPDLRTLDRIRRPTGLARALLSRGGPAGEEADEHGAFALELARLRDMTDAPILAACLPIAGGGPVSRWLQRLAGTPLTNGTRSPWPELSAMAYTSFALPWLAPIGGQGAERIAAAMGGWLARRHAEACRAAEVRCGVICGTNCVGIFEDEPSFASPEAMAPLVRAVARAGVHSLGIFNLSGLVYGPAGGSGPPRPDLWRRWGLMLARELVAGTAAGG